MRPDVVVVVAPLFDDDLCFFQRVEQLAVQQLVAQPAVEALVVAVFPRAAGFDKCSPDAQLVQPVPEHLRRELAAIVGTDVVGNAFGNEQVAQSVEHIIGFQ